VCAGVAVGTDDSGRVSLSCPTPGTKIRYSVNGAAAQDYSQPFGLPKGGKVVARAEAAGLLPSGSTEVAVEPTVDRSRWRVVSADSEERGEGNAAHVLDNNPNTYWHTQWSGAAPKHPHEIVIDLGEPVKLAGVRLMQRTDQANGRIKNCEIFVSEGNDFGPPAVKTGLSNSTGWQAVRFPKPVTARRVKVRALDEVGGNPWTALSEFNILPQAE
jgi:beta-galactosidase